MGKQLAVVVVAAIALAVPTGALGHGARGHGSMSERELRQFETATLGAEHAAEHAEERRIERRERRRWRTLTPAERRRQRRHERRSAHRLARVSAQRAPADEIGRWTHAPFPLPHYAIHTVLMPTGKLLFWGFPAEGQGNNGNGTIWDPAKGYGPAAFENVPPPLIDPDGPGPQGMVSAPLYCSGQTLLADGEVLVTGGNLVLPNETDPAYSDWAGLDRVFTFDPWSETWTEQPRMEDGRWYPSQALLGDGRTVIFGGFGSAAPGGVSNDTLEVFKPGAGLGASGTITQHPEVSRHTELYPHLVTMPSGDVLLAGPRTIDTGLLDVGSGTDPFNWRPVHPSHGYRVGGNAVLRPGPPSGSWKVTQIGGFGYTGVEPNGNELPTATTETVDASRPGEGWKLGSPLHVARSYQNTVLLPDSSMVTVGGGLGSTPKDGVYAIDKTGARRQVELYDPRTRKWRLGPAQLEDRGYHSTAVLLPDGRVFSGGDNWRPLEPDGSHSKTDSGEIYSPPYLFKGPRPVIRTAPSTSGWDRRIEIGTGRAAPAATSAVLVAPSATTHAADMSQRVVQLRVEERHGHRGIEVRTPPKRTVAPPGYYMLFVLDDAGVPSVAKWIRLGHAG